MQAKKKIILFVILLILCGLLLCVCAILGIPTENELMCQKVNYVVDNNLLQYSQFESVESNDIHKVKAICDSTDVFLWGTNKENIYATVNAQFGDFELVVSFYNDRIRINVEGDSYRDTEYGYRYWCDVNSNLEPLSLDDAEFWNRITYECISEDELCQIVRKYESFLESTVEKYY